MPKADEQELRGDDQPPDDETIDEGWELEPADSLASPTRTIPGPSPREAPMASPPAAARRPVDREATVGHTSVGEVEVADGSAIDVALEAEPARPPLAAAGMVAPRVAEAKDEAPRRPTLLGTGAPAPAREAESPAPSPVAPPPSPPASEPAIGEALTQRVRLGGARFPMWNALLAATGAAAALGAAIGFFATRSRAPADVPQAPSAPHRWGEAASASAAPVELSARAAAGDPEAIEALEKKAMPERASEEVLAVSQGRVQAALLELRKLEGKLHENAGLLRDRQWQALLRRRAYEPDTYRETLRILAQLPGPESADMLYTIWTGVAARTDATKLAEQLVYSKDVRDKASPALAVALDLRRAETCEEHAALLERAREHGDQRSFVYLKRLETTAGCGKDRSEDCYACLREGTALPDALQAVSRRAPPRY